MPVLDETNGVSSNFVKKFHLVSMYLLMWAKSSIMLCWTPFVYCLSACPSRYPFIFFHISTFQNHRVKFDYAWHKSFLGQNNARLFKYWAMSFVKGRIIDTKKKNRGNYFSKILNVWGGGSSTGPSKSHLSISCVYDSLTCTWTKKTSFFDHNLTLGMKINQMKTLLTYTRHSQSYSKLSFN